LICGELSFSLIYFNQLKLMKKSGIIYLNNVLSLFLILHLSLQAISYFIFFSITNFLLNVFFLDFLLMIINDVILDHLVTPQEFDFYA
jgi:hypothetical protein